MDPLAKELNDIIKETNPNIYEMLSEVGKNLYFPKGILSQSAEAKEKAHRFNATIGMAKEGGKTMFMPSVMSMMKGLEPEETLTYAPSYGIMSLREAWRKAIIEKNPSLKDYNISLPIVTNAITHALSISADVWADPEDAIILPDKMWGNYNMIFSIRRSAKVIQYTLFNEEGRFNLEAFRSCLEKESKNRKKLIVILNFPNNPTGYTVTPAEGTEIAHILTEIAKNGTNVIALTDDAYFGLFYEGDISKESIFTKLVGRDPRLLAVKLDGATKENYVWGLRVGFITYGVTPEDGSSKINDALERKTAGAVRGSISNASHLSQTIILRSLNSGSYAQEKQEKFEIMNDRAHEVKKVLSDTKYDRYWEAYPFNSGYFMCLRLKNIEAEKLRVHMLQSYGIGLISLGKTDIRVAFSCIEKDDVKELFEQIMKGCMDLEQN